MSWLRKEFVSAPAQRSNQWLLRRAEVHHTGVGKCTGHHLSSETCLETLCPLAGGTPPLMTAQKWLIRMVLRQVKLSHRRAEGNENAYQTARGRRRTACRRLACTEEGEKGEG